MVEVTYEMELIPMRTEKHTSDDINFYYYEIEALLTEWISNSNSKYESKYELNICKDNETLLLSYDRRTMYKSDDLYKWIYKRLNNERDEYIIYYSETDDIGDFPYDTIKGKHCMAMNYEARCLNFILDRDGNMKE